MATTDGSTSTGSARVDRPDGWSSWFAPTRDLRLPPIDVLLALVVALVQVAGTIIYSQDETNRWGFDELACALLLAGPVALLVRRRAPEAALVVALAAAAGYAATGYPRGPAGFPAFAVAVVSALVMGRRMAAWIALAIAGIAFTVLPSVVPDEVEAVRGIPQSAANLVWLPLIGAVGELGRIGLERRAERARAERDEARRRASEARLLMARELHDVLAHTISLISVRSGVALHLLDDQPEQARPALEAINAASDEALEELRSVLDLLHRGLDDDREPGPSGAWAPRTPTAGLRDLDGLVERTRTAGLTVDVAVSGEVRPVPAGVDLAAFRVVQEALTNVVRHAGGDARATVRLDYGPAELVVQVDDDGRGAGPAAGGSDGAGGRGLLGMRERVHALGGTFSGGAGPDRGFRVRAQLPLRDGVAS